MDRAKPHWSFWLVGLLGLIWNLMASGNFYMQVTETGLASFPEQMLAYIETRPNWATIGFGVSVVCGVLGCLLLLLRYMVSPIVLFVSVVGTAVALAHAYMAVGASDAQIFIPTLVALFVSILLYAYARYVLSRGLLGD